MLQLDLEDLKQNKSHGKKGEINQSKYWSMKTEVTAGDQLKHLSVCCNHLQIIT